MARIVLDSFMGVLSVPEQISDLIVEAATFEHPDYERSMKEGIHCQETVCLANPIPRSGQFDVYLPRGMAYKVFRGLEAFGIDYSVIDNMTPPEKARRDYADLDFDLLAKVGLRDYQIETVKKMLSLKQCVVKAPPGSGKTFMALAAIALLDLRACIIVDRLSLREQWESQAASFMKRWVSETGKRMPPVSVFTKQELSASSSQTVYTSSIVVVDECHHVSAKVYFDTISRFYGIYRWGLSATPDHNEKKTAFIEAIFGDTIDVIGRDDLIEEGHIKKAGITVAHTKFAFDYLPTRRIDGRLVRNNYGEMMEAIISDRERNELIARHVFEQAFSGRKCIVLSKRVGHLDAIAKAIDELLPISVPVMKMIGNTKKGDRAEIMQMFRRSIGGAVLLTTLADEGLDAPEADAIFLVYPARNEKIIEQQIGRVQRVHEGKRSPIVFDFADTRVALLRGQYRNRLAFYESVGSGVEVVDYSKEMKV